MMMNSYIPTDENLSERSRKLRVSERENGVKDPDRPAFGRHP